MARHGHGRARGGLRRDPAGFRGGALAGHGGARQAARRARAELATAGAREAGARQRFNRAEPGTESRAHGGGGARQRARRIGRHVRSASRRSPPRIGGARRRRAYPASGFPAFRGKRFSGSGVAAGGGGRRSPPGGRDGGLAAPLPEPGPGFPRPLEPRPLPFLRPLPLSSVGASTRVGAFTTTGPYVRWYSRTGFRSAGRGATAFHVGKILKVSLAPGLRICHYRTQPNGGRCKETGP